MHVEKGWYLGNVLVFCGSQIRKPLTSEQQEDLPPVAGVPWLMCHCNSLIKRRKRRCRLRLSRQEKSPSSDCDWTEYYLLHISAANHLCVIEQSHSSCAVACDWAQNEIFCTLYQLKFSEIKLDWPPFQGRLNAAGFTLTVSLNPVISYFFFPN